MLQPCAEAVPLLAKLVERPPSFFSRVFAHLQGASELVPPSKKVLAECLLGLERLGDYRVIYYIVWLLKFPEAAEDAAATIAALVPKNTRHLVMLDQSMRQWNWGGAPLWWPKDLPFLFPRSGGLKVKEVTRLLTSPLSTSVIGVLSFAADGHVRELALRSLNDIRTGDELPFLLLRLNDWVHPIAKQAHEAVCARLTTDYCPHIASRLDLFDRIASQNRRNHSTVVGKLETLLTQTANGKAALLYQVIHGQWEIKRSATVLISRCWPKDDGVPDEVWQALTDDDCIVRNSAINICERLCTAQELKVLTLKLVKDTVSFIRRRGFALAETHFPDTADQLAELFLFDSNAWLREFSRQRLKARGSLDFAERYRTALCATDGQIESGALLGLMETGSPGDARITAAFVNSPRKVIRFAALRATCSLAPTDAEGPLLSALASPSPALSGLARNLIDSSRYIVSVSQITSLIESPHSHVRANAMRLVHKVDKWAGLVIALRLRSDSDLAVVADAKNIVDWWRSIPAVLYSTPNAEQRVMLRNHFDSDSQLSQIRKNIEFMLGGTLS